MLFRAFASIAGSKNNIVAYSPCKEHSGQKNIDSLGPDFRNQKQSGSYCSHINQEHSGPAEFGSFSFKAGDSNIFTFNYHPGHETNQYSKQYSNESNCLRVFHELKIF